MTKNPKCSFCGERKKDEELTNVHSSIGIVDFICQDCLDGGW